MNPDVAIDLFKSTVLFAIYVVAPFLALTLIVGLIASLAQSVTSIQEPTLTFVPKIAAIFVVMIIFGAWMIRTLVNYTYHVFAFIEKL